MQISQIDTNFIREKVGNRELAFYDAKKSPFTLYGISYDYERERYCRMPDEIARTVSERAVWLSTYTAGGRIRFKTNSKTLALKVTYPNLADMSTMSLVGSSGCTIYLDKEGKSYFYNSIYPTRENKTGYDGIIYFDGEEDKDITIYTPLYNAVTELFIGLDIGAKLEKGREYTNKKKILYYGSSITQGGCVSHAGNTYPAYISRWLDCDYINLGLSGSAQGEENMAKYLASLHPDVFVCGYDHNAANVEHLKITHERLFKIFREQNRNIPVVILSKPDFDSNRINNYDRREVIKATYANAKAKGDKNVYFIDGETLFSKEDRDACTVEALHPNDLGFYRIAQVLYQTLKELV
ncbi:MAG: hypothetical protein IJT84_05105 [Clostridia bacterium]|nr:hypothetical protein [Clostridia bacterium]